MLNIYKASAGSGKTYILVKEYLKKSLSSNKKISHQSLLAITFTNKAASEMKTRIISTLFQFSNGREKIKDKTFQNLYDDIKTELNYTNFKLVKRSKKVLSDIIHYYGLFSVSTIDKFVYKIIREFTYELELPSNFDVEMDKDNIILDGVLSLIDDAGTDNVITNNLIQYSKYKTNQNKNWDIQADLCELSNQLFKDQKFLIINNLTNSKKIKNNQKLLEMKILFFEEKIKNTHKSIKGLINSIPDQVFPYKALPNYLKKISKKPYKEILISNKENTRIYNSIQNNIWYKKTENTEYKNRINNISSILNLKLTQLMQFLDQEYSNYRFYKECYNSCFLLSVLKQIDSKIQNIKKENNIIHISEFQEIIMRFLKQNPVPFIYEKIGTRYKHYFIDEFQDTSKIQWSNIIPLVEEGLSKGGECLIVGDGKQSIYRWRGGEVKQFLDLFNTQKREVLNQFPVNMNSLNINYRSGKNIVVFNNLFFSFLSENLDGVYHDLYHQLNQTPHQKNKGYVEISMLDSKEGKLIDQTLEDIYKKIKNTINDGYSFSDISILTRNNKEITNIATHLTEKGIHIVSSESLLLKNSETVKFIIYNLHVFLNEFNFLSRAKLLEYLISNRIINGFSSNNHEVIAKLARCNNQQFQSFFNTLGIDYNIDALKRLNVYELVEQIIRLFDLNKKNNLYLNFFLDFVFEFSVKQTNSISGFINYWSQKSKSASIVIPSGIDAIEIMTIHKSKGLQFPVVIFPFANWKDDLGKDRKWFSIKNDVFKNTNNTFFTLLPLKKELECWPKPFPIEYEKHKKEVLLDNINLLYVAMTRPKDRLYIISNNDAKRGTIYSYFTQFLNHNKFKKLNTNTFFYGEKGGKKTNKKTPKPLKVLESISEEWRQRVRIKKDLSYSKPQSANKLVWGDLLHQIMAHIQTKFDLEDVLKRMNIKNKHGKAVYEKIKHQIKGIINSEHISHLFENNTESFLETSILSKNGKIHRPDRVVVHSNFDASLIDYKTGQEEMKHFQQIKKYEQLLLKLGYKKINKYLVYLSTGKIKKLP